MNDTKIVMFASDEAAHLQTGISGWVSRNGRFFGNDERAARYDGCTHVSCEDCGEPTERGWLICENCREVRDINKYNAMPKVKWDGKGMIFSMSHDKYFSSWDEVEDYCDSEELTTEVLRLIICEPNYLHPIDPGDFGCDELAEEGELPDEVIEALEKFNAVIKKTGPVSWTPCNRAVLLES